MNKTLSASRAGKVIFGEKSKQPLTVNRLGLGTNRITDTEKARAVLKHAVALDVNFIDTAELYQSTESEATIGKILAPYPKGVVVATKAGMSLIDSSPVNDPAYLRQALEGSLKRLKLNQILLYQLHRVDSKVPISQTAQALKDFQEEGKVLHLGLSEVTVEQIEEFRETINVVSVQNQYNIMERKHEAVLDYCEREGIIFIPWYPLAKAKSYPDSINRISKKYEVTPVQIAIAWLLRRSLVMLPIPGTLSIEHLEQNLAAADIELSEEDYEELSNI